MCHEPLHVPVTSVAETAPPELDGGEATEPSPESLESLQALKALPAPDSDPLPLPPPVAGVLDERVVEQMLIELAASDDDLWAARSRRFSARRAQVVLGLAVGVGVVLVLLIAAAVVGRIVG